LDELEQIHYFCAGIPVLTSAFVKIYRRPAGDAKPTQTLEVFLSALLSKDHEFAIKSIRDIYLQRIKPSMDQSALQFYRERILECIKTFLMFLKGNRKSDFPGQGKYWSLEEELRSMEFFINTVIEDKKDSSWKISPLAARCLIIIAKRFREPISLSELADDLKVSKSYLSRLFKKDMRMGIVEYLQKFRVEAAKNMMFDGVDNIHFIARNCGFADPQYFSRIFRHSQGVSPSYYIENVIREKRKTV
jgi:YesN/AraC family two-component response regulator